MDKLQELARRYMDDKFTLSTVEEKLARQGPSCDRKLHFTWDCCNFHKALRAVHEALGERGDELDEAYHLGGISNAYFVAFMKGEDTSSFHHVSTAPQVGSQAWLEQLSRASSVPLPDEKPVGWITRA